MGVDVYQECINIGEQGLHCCLDCQVLQVTDTPKVNLTKLLLHQVLYNTISLLLQSVASVTVEGQQVYVGNAAILEISIKLILLQQLHLHFWQLAGL